MNETIIKACIFAGGVAVGALASKVYFERKYKKIADDEIESCKKVFKKYAKKAMENIEEKELVTSEPVDIPSYDTKDNSEVISYTDYHDKEKEFEAELDYTNEMKTLYPTDDEDEPYEISIEEYEEDLNYDKVTLNYFLEDGALIYEESEKITNDEETIGIQNLDDFALNETVMTSYFRNPKVGVDYEVVKIDGSYKELIAGDN